MDLRTDAQRHLELSLYMEDKHRDMPNISKKTWHDIRYGLEGWVSWLDARAFTRHSLRHNLHPEMSVEFMQEVHRRLRIRHDPEGAGQMLEDGTWGVSTLTRPLSRNERAAIEENPLLAYVPGPFRPEPHGIVFSPQIEGPPGARTLRWLDAPPTESELAAIKDDPLQDYMAPGALPAQEHGVIVYPAFGTDTREFHVSLCDRYNNTIRQSESDHDRYWAAGEFVRDLVGAHQWKGDGHGRHGLALLHSMLERSGMNPSAIANYNPLGMSPPEWVDTVRAGSERYGRWRELEQAHGDIDPIDLLDL
ncbi:hypothetical protein [Nocardia brevicatena]|uniref:hypothetical protein n=1 Tax=Nocardia brevicatena TaxID=37327 RepID=UPI0002F0CF51|nr:hypothetical protein [Nocardia brevicatena]